MAWRVGAYRSVRSAMLCYMRCCGLQVSASGRLVFNAHYQTAERADGAVVVYYSDDGGDTYRLAASAPFAHMDESTMTEVPS